MFNESGPLESVREVVLAYSESMTGKGPVQGARTMQLLAVTVTERLLLSAIFGPMSLIFRGC